MPLDLVHPDTSQLKFAFDPFLKKEYRFGMDPDRPICRYYASGPCPRGKACPDKHILPSYSNKIVCKHWLRGLCKKGESCEFLHEYNLRKMPECLFFSKNGFCTQSPDCLYLHIDPMSKIPVCPNYEKGYCRDGPDCPRRHVRRAICAKYLTGFCPEGPDCGLGHPQFVMIKDDMRIARDLRSLPVPEFSRDQSYDGNDRPSEAIVL
jgi:cleavage and polyadenylation specificity factor subunit 4